MSRRETIRGDAAAALPRLKAAYPGAFSIRPTLQLAAVAALVIVAAGLSMIWLDFSTERLSSGLRRLGHFISLMWPPSAGGHFMIYFKSLMETLAIAYLGTLLAALLAFPVGFLAAKNVIPNVFVHFGVRRALDTIRGVDTLIWALIWVTVVGLGPFAGVLAIACSDFGSFGKLFSEAIETADKRPVEGVVSSGGSALQGHRYGILPQVIPVIGSQVLYFFESNTRSATIIGIVGAGGIGVHLAEQVRGLEMDIVAFLILLILAAVTVIDFISSRLRLAMIGQRQET
jgi:phosphonate transport system permease protein